MEARKTVLNAIDVVATVRKRWTLYSAEGLQHANALANATLKSQHAYAAMEFGAVADFASLREQYANVEARSKFALVDQLERVLSKLAAQCTALHTQLAQLEPACTDMQVDYGVEASLIRPVFQCVSLPVIVNALRAIVQSYDEQLVVFAQTIAILTKSTKRANILQCLLVWQLEPLLDVDDYDALASLVITESRAPT